MPAAPGPQTERLDRLRRMMKDEGVEAVLVTSPANRRYYSGFEADDPMMNESSGCLLIMLRSQYLLTDSRYTEAAAKEGPRFKVLDYRRGLAAELAALPALKKIPTIHFEPEFTTVALLTRLREGAPKIRWEPLPFDPGTPRARKSPEEIKLVAKALAITEAAVSALWAKMEPGLTEREAAFFLEAEFRRLGAEGPSFETIVASGPNGALPHAVPGPRKMKAGDMIIVDCGARYRGYCADITRTKILGEPKPWQREIYSIVRQAQLMAIKAIAPGKPASAVDRVAREHIAKAGYGPYFGHGLGHGVGLVIHEAPSLSPRNHHDLEPGQIVTVEPGIYLPGRGGVRLEQLVLVTDKGHRLLNRNLDFYEF